MDAQEQIMTFKEFINDEYHAELAENTRIGDMFLVLDFEKLCRFNLELANLILDDPEETLKSAEVACEQFDFAFGSEKPSDSSPKINANKYKVRIKNLPESSKVSIRNIRSTHLNRFARIEGIVRQKSDVRPMATSSRFECPSCGNVIPVLQLDTKFKEPARCGCGRKGKFKLLSKELVDAQSIILEEDTNTIDGNHQPKRMKVLMKDDLVSPMSEKRTAPGTKIIMNGIIKEVPVVLRNGAHSTQFDIMIEAKYFEPVEEEFDEIVISKEEEQKIIELAQREDIYDLLIHSVAPGIYGHKRVKDALILQMVSGVKNKICEDGEKLRHDMHILLIGDPGSGKSALLKRINRVAPKSRFISGRGASAAGITASVVKDEFIGGWALEAGAIVLAHKGILCLDELDKMSDDDTSAMHEALEGQLITLSKANIQATLRCETTVLAAANPKFGRFDPYSKTIAEQIKLPSTLINRFDLIFPIKDIPEPQKDENLGTFVIQKHMQANPINKKKNTEKSNQKESKPNTNEIIETNLLRKFIAYTSQKSPLITDETMKIIVDYYTKIRGTNKTEGKRNPVGLSARQLEGLVRLAEGYAKIRLSEKVEPNDADKAISIMKYCLEQIALDEDTGTVDIDKIATDTSNKSRSIITDIKRFISELQEQFGTTVPMEEIVKKAQEKGISEDKVDSAIEQLRRAGDVFEPKRGFISKI